MMEATGASPGVAPSRPHRSGPQAGPGRRTPCARGAWGGEPAGGWASDLPAVVNHRRGPGLCSVLWRSGRAVPYGCPPRFRVKKGTRSLLLRCSSSKSTRRPPKSPIHSRESRKRGGADSSRPEPADPQRGRASLTCSDENPPSARRRNQHRSGLSDEARELVWLLWSKPDRCWSMEERAAASSPRQETRNSPKQVNRRQTARLL